MSSPWPSFGNEFQNHSTGLIHSFIKEFKSRRFNDTKSTPQPSATSLLEPILPYALFHQDENGENMSANFVAPGQQRYLRACMVCSIVMTYAVRQPPTPASLSKEDIPIRILT